MSVGILGGRVVPPNVDILDILNWHFLAFCNNALSTALIKTRQSSEVLLGDAWSKVRCNKCIGVGGIAYNTDLNSLLRDLVKSLALSLENLSVGAEEITTFHAGTTRFGTHEHRNINILEADKRVSGADDLVNEGISTVVELHDEAFEDFLSCGQLDQVKDNLLVGSKHAALGNKIAKEGTDGTSSAGNSDLDWCLRVSCCWEMSANVLESFYHLCFFFRG